MNLLSLSDAGVETSLSENQYRNALCNSCENGDERSEGIEGYKVESHLE